MCDTVDAMVRSLAIAIPAQFTAGVRCSVGAVLQLPMTITASGVRACTITVRAEGEAIGPSRREVKLDPKGSEVRVVLGLIARTATLEPVRVTVGAVCDEGLSQTAGFSLEIGP